jgi:hypothetical protein
MIPSTSETSRLNGAKSRGPKTDEGRHAASLNAVKHGLSAETVVLPGESAEQYAAELSGYLHHFQPANKPEADLVRQLASVHWRMIRYTRVETGLFDLELEKQRGRFSKQWDKIQEDRRLAYAFEALSGVPSLALLNRYESRLHHEYQRVLKSLVQLQTTRRASESKLQNEPRQPGSQPVDAPASVLLLAPQQPVEQATGGLPDVAPQALFKTLPDALHLLPHHRPDVRLEDRFRRRSTHRERDGLVSDHGQQPGSVDHRAHLEIQLIGRPDCPLAGHLAERGNH